MIDVSHMTMEEILQFRARCTDLSQKYDHGKLPFYLTVDEVCTCCGHHSYWVEPVETCDGRIIPGYMNKIELLVIDGKRLCRKCFVWHYYNLPWKPSARDSGHARDGAGSPHSGIPPSQMNYDGGNFNSGEW